MEIFKSILIYCLFFLIYLFLYYHFLKFCKVKGVYGIKKNILLFSSTIPLIILFSFRNYSVGTDFKTYLDYYKMVKSFDLNFDVLFNSFLEPLWIIISYFFNLFNIPFRVFLIFICSVFCWFQILIVNKFENKYVNFLCQLIIYVTMFSLFLNTTRQQLAAIIILYSLFLLKDNKIIKYFVFIIIASMIHKSSLIALSFPLFKMIIRNNKLTLVLLFVIFLSPLWAFLVEKPFNYLLYLLNPYNPYINVGNGFDCGFLFYTIPLLVIIFVLYMYSKKKNIFFWNNYIKFLFFLYMLHFLCQSMGGYFFPLERLSFYFSAVQVILCPEILNLFKNNKGLTTIFSCFVLWYIIYYFVMFIILRGNEIYPFYFIGIA